jgi:hypothetical protein
LSKKEFFFSWCLIVCHPNALSVGLEPSAFTRGTRVDFADDGAARGALRSESSAGFEIKIRGITGMTGARELS